jgi:predicted transcriptional regulator
MSKDAVFTIKLEENLRNDFIAAAKADHRPASQVMRSLMRDYIQSKNNEQEYIEFLRGKVEAGRASMLAGLGRTNDEVEAEFAARHAAIADENLINLYITHILF